MRASLRLLLLLAACAVLAIVLRDYLGSRKAGPAIAPAVLPVLPEDLGAQSQGWQWTQSAGESTRIEARAESLVQGADGLRTDLRNAVVTIFHEDSGTRDRVESAAMRLTEGGDLYSEGETLITVGIAESGLRTPAVVTTSGVTFLTAENRARTESAARYDLRDWEGSSVGAVFDAATGEVRMLSAVRLRRKGGEETDGPAEIRAGSLHYSEGGARIDLSGGASVRQGHRSIECAEATLWIADGRIQRIDGTAVRGKEEAAGRASRFVTPNLAARFGERGELLTVRGEGPTRFASHESGQRIGVRGERVEMHYEPGPVEGQSVLRRVEAVGAASATLEAGGDGAVSTLRSQHLRLALRPGSGGIESVEALQRGELDQMPAGAGSPARTLQGDRIRFRYGEATGIESLVATGDTRLLQQSEDAGAPVLRTAGDRLEASFDPVTSAMAGILQEGRFRFEEVTPEGGVQRSGGAKRANFELEGGVVELEGPATVSDGHSVISAQRVTVNRETGRLAARDRATVSMPPADAGGDGAAPTGLFAGPQAVLALADSIDSVPETGALELRDSARLWQAGNRIDADAIVLGGEASGFRADGSVTAAWVDSGGAGAGQAGSATVRAERMLYEQQTGEAVFQGAVDFRRAGLRVLSDELRTWPGAGADGGEGRAVATGSVRIAQFADGIRARGFGDRAEFRLADSEIVLTGDPARVAGRDGTQTRGSSLTLRASGDSLLVSGRGAERAYTYHPASR